MPELLGTDAVEKLRANSTNTTLFILMSTNHAYMKAGFSVEAFDFLCKPFIPHDVSAVLDRTAYKLASVGAGIYTLYTDKTQYKVNIRDICYFDCGRNYVKLVAATGVYTFRKTLKELLSELPDFFIQSSRGTVINIMNVVSISNTEASFRHISDKAPISKSHLECVLDAFRRVN